jgi:choline dehydrogenase-like flavoprotein
VKLDWRTSRIDVDSVAGLVAALDRELRRLGLGEAESAPWLQDETRAWHTAPLNSSHPIGGYHHMGTTRMSDSPRTGVTDGEGKVHGLANLYVAGSSLFATAGWANPTQTILALALRTADAISRDSAASPGKHATVTDMRSPAASFIQEIEQATVQLQPEAGTPQPARSKPADEVVAG